jgi:hypothetical protein
LKRLNGLATHQGSGGEALVNDDHADTVDGLAPIRSGESLHTADDDIGKLMRLLATTALDDGRPDAWVLKLDPGLGLRKQFLAVSEYEDSLAFLAQPLGVSADQCAEDGRLAPAGRDDH